MMAQRQNSSKQLQETAAATAATMNSSNNSNNNNSSISNQSNQLENIKVAVRLRPFTQKEKERNNKRIVDIRDNTVVLYNLHHNDVQLKKFTFDYSYWSHDGFRRDQSGINVPDASHPNSSRYVGQDKVFEDLGSFLLKNALEGYNSALLAYGQTGSGKSYTVSGYGQNEGILPRFARALFIELESKVRGPEAGGVTRYEVYFSMLEIYNEVVRDLLAKNHGDMMAQSSMVRRGLKVREHPKYGFFVENLTSFACANKDEIESRIEEGQLNKSIAATSMNEMSSRGHTIYEFRIKQYSDGSETQNNLTTSKAGGGEETSVTTSVVQLVDLAGSERMAVHVTGGDGSSFIGSRSNTPYPRTQTQERPVPRTRTSKISSAAATATATTTTAAPVSASSSNESSHTANTNSTTKRGGQQREQSGSLPPIHGGSTTHLQRFKESVAINQSLSALGNCIQVLSQYSQQLESSSQPTKKAPPKIPYRDSVLTKLLNRCCLSGNSKVVLIATLSPIDTNYDDTLSTLRFADRAKRIRTHAIINKVERSEILNEIRSQLDEGEILEEGENLSAGSRTLDAVATPTRSRRTTRRTPSTSDKKTMTNSRSQQSLVIKQEQMKRIVSPASSRKIAADAASRKGGKTSKRATTKRDDLESPVDDELELDDIEEGLISSDEESEEAISLSGFKLDHVNSEEMTTEEKIQLFNRMLSNRAERPRRSKNASERAGLQKVPIISSNLKKDNPYLSNLNPDEQLTGVIGYIVKQGETIIGKGKECDIVLHGPELRGQHAKLTRQEDNTVSIEPIMAAGGSNQTRTEQVALMVNGSPVSGKVQLNHCDRLLFGTNAYFVFANRVAATTGEGQQSGSGETLADLDMVTYDMARNEVLRKYMAENKNEAMLKEINDYTHRPGTGKHRVRSADMAKSPIATEQDSGSSRLLRTMTIQDQEEEPFLEKQESSELTSGATGGGDGGDAATAAAAVGEKAASPNEETVENQEAMYRERLMEDTYEYTLPVAEVNAVTKEMGIKVNYGLKILTGEEQIPDQLATVNDHSSNTPDGLSVSSGDVGGPDGTDKTGTKSRAASGRDETLQPASSHLSRLDGLDIPPALYIRVSLEEFGLDFYWSKEKFEARRFKILELYGPWDVAGKSGLVEHLIDQSKYQGDYLIDPFVDDPSNTFVLIGHAQITLKPISHLSDLEETFDIIDLDDGTVGSIKIQATPCDTTPLPSSASSTSDHHNGQQQRQQTFREFSESELEQCLLDSPSHLLNKKLVLKLTIKSCLNIPARFCNIFCQYQLSSELPLVRTKLLRETGSAGSMESATESEDGGNRTSGQEEEEQEELQFDHSHFICFDNVNRDILDFLEHGFLTIQVIGQYKLSPEEHQKPPTVISTIISSINKYRMKIEQQQHQHSGAYSGGGGYPNGGAYYGSQTGSSKSNRGQSSSGGAMNSNSASSVVSTSATVNLFDPQNDDEDGSNSINSLSQENIIDMILTKRKLDRAENQLHYLKRTINIAEHYNKKHIPLKTIKKLLNSYGHELESGSLEEFADVTSKTRTSNNKSSACVIQ